MRQLALSLILAMCLSACETEKTVAGQVVPFYGIFNKENEDKCINYTLSGRNVIGGIMFSETLLIPGLVLGFWLWKPVSKKANCK